MNNPDITEVYLNMRKEQRNQLLADLTGFNKVYLL